jgi:hypothetical protein
MADQYMMVFHSDIVAEGDLEGVLQVASAQLAQEGVDQLEEAKPRLLRVIEVPIKLTPARGPSIEVARVPRKAAQTEKKPTRAAIQCPVDGCTDPGGGRRRAFCEKHWALVPASERPRKLAEAEDKARLLEIVKRALKENEHAKV